ncbi:MAG: LysR family transcriptional regulator [Pseudomonadota bacterium]
MELRQLERFLAVADYGSMAAAARRLKLTQQALSASLAGLEAELDVRLFDRSPGGRTTLTAFGERLLDHARAQLAADRRARDELADLRDAKSGVVTIGVGETFSGDVIATAILALAQSRPRVRINVVESYSELLLSRLHRGEFDFVAVGVDSISQSDEFEATAIYSANDVVACRGRHPLAAKTTLELADLSGYPWLVPYARPSDTDVIIETFANAGLAPPTQFTGSDAFRIGRRLLDAADYLLMTTPELISSRIAADRDGLTVLPIDRPTVRRTASLVLNKDRPLTPAAKALYDNVTERIETSAALR